MTDPVKEGRPMAERICTVEDCERAATRRGWCKRHYSMWWSTGDPLGSTDKRPRRSVMRSGYVRVWCRGHPAASSDGYALEHRKVMIDAGFDLPPGCHVHHLNGDKTDNRLENLAVHSASEHIRLHIAADGFVRNQFGVWPLKNRSSL